jgi:hypothetical protein
MKWTTFLALPLIMGCAFEKTEREEERVAPDVSAGGEDTAGEPVDDDTGERSTGDDTDGAPIGDDTEAPPHDTEPVDTAPPDEDTRAPRAGELVITEVMINPAAVYDEQGEWIELYSGANSALELSGLYLADADTDFCALEFTGSSVIERGQFLVICVDTDEYHNGGVICDAHIAHSSTGGDGCAFANSGDEIILFDVEGTALDRLRYGETFAPAGASAGLDPDHYDPGENDDTDLWCPQTGDLPAGDQGTPGADNTSCSDGRGEGGDGDGDHDEDR